jgi:hypothetical protein
MDYFVEKHSAKAGKWLGRRIDTAANSFHGKVVTGSEEVHRCMSFLGHANNVSFGTPATPEGAL